MRIGIIFVAFNSADLIDNCLSSWVDIKNSLPDHNFIYSCVSVPFDRFTVENIDNTADIIKSKNIMDFMFVDSQAKSEIAARGICLNYLKEQNCDLVWMVDSDEFYTVENIKNIINYIEKNEKFGWYKLCLKNKIGDRFLKEPFTPPRIFRVNFLPYKLGEFRDDNSMTYFYNGAEIPDLFVKNKLIPKETAFIIHESWPNSERSKKKIDYQNNRKWTCNYIYNEKENKVEFNPVAFKNKKLPEFINEQ